MKYSELVNFDPIESVVQIKDADKKLEAERLIKTYIISDDMSSKIVDIIIPHLQFDKPADNRGLLIVGNYGTGKSHLMSVLSSVAEDRDFMNIINHKKTQKELEQISGNFEVMRVEIGATEMQLKEIIFQELEEKLESLDIDFSFDEVNKKHNNKFAFQDLMELFNEKYPNKGLLLIVDELLDFLRTKNEQELIKDLNFLREIGEVCKDLRFRFIAGIQEAIFDNPRFGFVSEQLRRVKDRFEQIHIDRKDIKFVVANRLLNKTDEQRAIITAHLEKFGCFYAGMNERMDDFVNLFPVHPDYIDIFDRISVIEKRQVLKTLSQAMEKRLDKQLDPNFPQIIAFDSFYDVLKANPAYRSIPEIKSVIDCSETLQDLVKTNYPRGKDTIFAIRIIKALSVHRLTVGSLSSPTGLTAEGLRDMLCLYNPIIAELGGEEPSEDLKGEVETTLRLISHAVSGQFISATERTKTDQLSGQFYLDITKNVDYAEKIRTKSEGLDKNLLDRYYYEALKILMECQDETYIRGYRMWEHELTWIEKNVTRNGYLFFGAPNERSTATPPRDFYIYFIQLESPPRFKDEMLDDELFFKLKTSDSEFYSYLKGYAASFELANTSSAESKNIYKKKGQEYLKKLQDWLQTNMIDGFEITYQGKKSKLSTAISAKNIGQQRDLYTSQINNFRDIVNRLASYFFSTSFENKAPKYPAFSIKLTNQNREIAIKDTLSRIAGQRTTKQANAILDALDLLEDEQIYPQNSYYSMYILNKLQEKGNDKVLNREEIIKDISDVEYMDPKNARLEPDLVMVIIAALIYSGDLVLSVQGTKYDATKLKQLASEKIQDLMSFKYVQRPKDWDIKALKTLFKLLELNTYEVEEIKNNKEEPVLNLQTKVDELSERAINTNLVIEKGIPFWGIDLLEELGVNKQEYIAQLNQTKDFLDQMRRYNTPGKLKNLQMAAEEIERYFQTIEIIKKMEAVQTFYNNTIQNISWFSKAFSLLFSQQDYEPNKQLKEWNQKVSEEKSTVLKDLKTEFNNGKNNLLQISKETNRRLEGLKEDYVKIYIKLHRQSRLGLNEKNRKDKLLSSNQLNNLETLVSIDLIPSQQLQAFRNELADLKVCYHLSEKELYNEPLCQHCGFNPATESMNSNALNIDDFTNELDEMVNNWTELLLNNLKDPIIKNNIDLLQNNEKMMIRQFLDAAEMPEHISDDFVKCLNTLFSGLQKVTIKKEDWLNIISEPGPITPEHLKKIVMDYIDKMISGKDEKKIRITLQ